MYPEGFARLSASSLGFEIQIGDLSYIAIARQVKGMFSNPFKKTAVFLVERSSFEEK
jgi:hypothetical protein